jgi:xanthine dehydrogenase accessory factor
MDHPRKIFRFLAAQLASGQGVALVTVTGVTGSSVRNPGAHMAVASDGTFIGSLTGGCIEAAVVSEARQAILEGTARRLFYGAGSPIIDIRLPCGGAVHLLVTPVADLGWCEDVLAAFTKREEAELALADKDGGLVHVRHAPPLRMAVLGYGAAAESLAQLALNMGTDLSLWSPDRELCERFGNHAHFLKTPNDRLSMISDAWTVASVLFHDHDWEAGLLRQLMSQPSLLIGAMGSRATHAARVSLLAKLGVPDVEIGRIKAPIGLIHSSRDPDTLALSAFVEAVDAYNRTKPSRLVDQAL